MPFTNGKFGSLLGQGKSVEEALEIMENATIEGISMTFNGYKLLKELENQGKINLKKDVPLFLEIYNVLYEKKSIENALDSYWSQS